MGRVAEQILRLIASGRINRERQGVNGINGLTTETAFAARERIFHFHDLRCLSVTELDRVAVREHPVSHKVTSRTLSHRLG